jgi:hypothetical protein
MNSKRSRIHSGFFLSVLQEGVAGVYLPYDISFESTENAHWAFLGSLICLMVKLINCK